MKSMEIIFILERMDQMIRLRATGCPSKFAQRLGVSERTIYNYLRILTDELGGRIRYSKSFCSYEYEDDQQLDIRISYLSKR